MWVDGWELLADARNAGGIRYIKMHDSCMPLVNRIRFYMPGSTSSSSSSASPPPCSVPTLCPLCYFAWHTECANTALSCISAHDADMGDGEGTSIDIRGSLFKAAAESYDAGIDIEQRTHHHDTLPHGWHNEAFVPSLRQLFGNAGHESVSETNDEPTAVIIARARANCSTSPTSLDI